MSTQTGSISFEATGGFNSYAKQNYATLSQIKGQFATCSTGATTAAKVATIVPADSGWTLYEGATVTVKFITKNTTTTPTLNVNGTGAKPIKDYAGHDLTKAAYEWPEGAAMTLTYDGSSWRIQDSNLMERVHTAETGIEQNSKDIKLKANANDVYNKEDVNGLIAQEVLDRDAAIELSATGITQSVSSNYATKTEFNNLQIGSRNLLQGSMMISSGSGKVGWMTNGNLVAEPDVVNLPGIGKAIHFKKNTTSNTSVPSITMRNVAILEWGKTYVYGYDVMFSVDVNIGTASIPMHYHRGSSSDGDLFNTSINNSKGIGELSINFTNEVLPANTWIHLERLWRTADSAPDSSLPYPAVRPFVFGQSLVTAAGSVEGWIRNPYVIEATALNKVTWTPAPEDLEAYTDTQVSSAKSEIKQTTDNITSTVEKISSIKQLASSVSTGWTLASIKLYATYDTSTTFSVTSTADAKVGDTVYIKGKDSTRNCTVYIKGLVTAVPSTTSITVKGRGYEDAVPVDSIKSTINQSADSVKIEAKHIEIDGTATFKNSDNTTTTLGNYLTNNYDAKGAAQTAIDSLEIGGRNLLKQTGTPEVKESSWNVDPTTMSSWAKWSNAWTVENTDSGIKGTSTSTSKTGFAVPLVKENAAIGGVEYVLSFDYRTNRTTFGDIYLLCQSGGNVLVHSNNCVASADEWQHYEQVITWPSTSGKTTRALLLPYFGQADDWFEIRNGSLKLERGNRATDWTPAPEDIESNAVSRTQRIYYQSASTTKPATPGTASTNWVTDETGAADKWTLKRMSYSSAKPYIYTCEQKQVVSGTVSYTPVLLDDTTTVIDGGKIITGSIDANAINANTISGSNLTISNFSDSDDYLNSNIQIGGRNLLRNEDVYCYSSAQNAYLDKDEYPTIGKVLYNRTATSNEGFYITNTTRQEIGESYVVHFDIADTQGVVTTIYIFTDGAKLGTAASDVSVFIDGVEAGTGNTNITCDLTGGATKHVDVYFKPTATPTSTYHGFILQPHKSTAAAYEVVVTNLKWEKGNHATDWTPAPEDQMVYVDESIDNINVGGRNLLVADAGKPGKWTVNAPTDSSFVKSESNDGYYVNITFNSVSGYENLNAPAVTVEVGQEYTLSCAYVVGKEYNETSGKGGYGLSVRTDSGGHGSYDTSSNCLGKVRFEKAVGSYHSSFTFVATVETIYLCLNGGQIADNQSGLSFDLYNVKLEKGNKATDWTPAPEDVDAAITTVKTIADAATPKTSAVSRTQRIYWRTTSTAGKPEVNNTWLSISGTGYDNWALTVPQLMNDSTKYPYLYTAVQSQTVAQEAEMSTECLCSPVLLDDTTTVIDGGNIITGSVTANQIASNTITASEIASNTITADKIASNTITADKLDVESIQANIVETDEIIVSAGKTASSFISEINENGITVHPKDISSEGVSITDRVEIIHGGTSVAEYGETFRLGSIDKVHLLGSSSKLAFHTNLGDIAYFGIDNDNTWSMYIEKAHVTNTLRFGNYAWFTRSNGNMTLKYIKE